MVISGMKRDGSDPCQDGFAVGRPAAARGHVFVTYFPPFPSLFSRFLSMNCEHWDTVTSGLPYAKNSLSQTEGMELGRQSGLSPTSCDSRVVRSLYQVPYGGSSGISVRFIAFREIDSECHFASTNLRCAWWGA